MYYILLLCNCVICINCHLGLSCVNNVFCYSLPGIGGQSYVDTANNNNNKLCPSLAKFNFINVFVFDVRNMHKRFCVVCALNCARILVVRALDCAQFLLHPALFPT